MVRHPGGITSWILMFCLQLPGRGEFFCATITHIELR
jgi:hypothetical protein